MQKLVTLYLSNYTADRMLHEDGDVREHLEPLLAQGWRIVSITAAGHVAVPNEPTAAWVVVLLEKN
jgi:hypothetical protein